MIVYREGQKAHSFWFFWVFLFVFHAAPYIRPTAKSQFEVSIIILIPKMFSVTPEVVKNNIAPNMPHDHWEGAHETPYMQPCRQCHIEYDMTW